MKKARNFMWSLSLPKIPDSYSDYIKRNYNSR